MTLRRVWSSYMQVLRARAPLTSASVRPPRSETELLEAERATAPWTDELRELFAVQDGQDATYAGRVDPGELLPELRLLPLDEVVALHRYWIRHPHRIDYLGPDWPSKVRAQSAGESAAMYVPEYIPFAEGLAGSFAYIDTRRGPHSGCVRFFTAEGADDGSLWYESLTDFVQQVSDSVDTDTPHGELIPTITDGTLLWEGDPSG
ncbi:MAG: SMI1/KNR4 family protein [Rhodococcus sp. (in: high G+C Gram-positive bacteria)]|uniref:SMI1/KNR4 family protein n=1 Tax=Rhodococcus sp. TaxID=1831 RepID=UPI002AD7467D|nr:SMI1/KNR4 family protein [Rhodococcus sp. (in: high G+C Gram-positive bacteria)]